MARPEVHARLSHEAQRRRLVRLCARISGDAVAAEDLAQETLLEAWRNAHKLGDPDAVDRWLAAIARNVCLRAARKRGREVLAAPLRAEPGVEDDLEGPLERAELVALVDRALGLVPADTRNVIVQRYVHEAGHAEIGERLGLSEDAVAMRLTRGKAVLRRVLAAELRDEPDDGWRETRVWCADCGRGRLDLRREAAPGAVSLRCPACTRNAAAYRFALDNPVFARLLDGLVRPTAILGRTADWVRRYFAAGAGAEVDCTRCGRPTRLRRYARDRDGRPSDGLYAHCASCGEQVSSAARGLVLALPEIRRFRRDHPRSRTVSERQIEFAGLGAILVRHRDVAGSSGLDVLLARETLRVLEVASA